MFTLTFLSEVTSNNVLTQLSRSFTLFDETSTRTRIGANKEREEKERSDTNYKIHENTLSYTDIRIVFNSNKRPPPKLKCEIIEK